MYVQCEPNVYLCTAGVYPRAFIISELVDVWSTKDLLLTSVEGMSYEVSNQM